MSFDGRALDTVVFDLGNVLIDWDPRYLYRKIFADEAEMEEFLRTVATPEWHLEQDRGRSVKEATELLKSRHPGYEKEIEAYYGRWDEMFGGPIDESVRALRELCKRGYALYALTNWSAELFPAARERHGFLGWFEDIVVSGEEGKVKPDREIYDALVERTGLDPETSVFVDDRKENVDAAERLGFTGIVFREDEGLGGELARLGLLGTNGKADG